MSAMRFCELIARWLAWYGGSEFKFFLRRLGIIRLVFMFVLQPHPRGESVYPIGKRSGRLPCPGCLPRTPLFPRFTRRRGLI